MKISALLWFAGDQSGFFTKISVNRVVPNWYHGRYAQMLLLASLNMFLFQQKIRKFQKQLSQLEKNFSLHRQQNLLIIIELPMFYIQKYINLNNFSEIYNIIAAYYMQLIFLYMIYIYNNPAIYLLLQILLWLYLNSYTQFSGHLK